MAHSRSDPIALHNGLWGSRHICHSVQTATRLDGTLSRSRGGNRQDAAISRPMISFMISVVPP